MAPRFYFTMEADWLAAPLAFWVHAPVPGAAGTYFPSAPQHIPHRGYVFLHVEMDAVDLEFSSLPQLDHFIDIVEKIPLPTSRQLSCESGRAAGPNGHWLSRLPATLKSPKRRALMAQSLRLVRQQVTSLDTWA